MSSGAHLSLRKHRPGPHIPGLLHPKPKKSSDWVFLWQGPYDGSVGADQSYLQGCGQLSHVSSSTCKQDPYGVRALGLKSFTFSAGERGYHGNHPHFIPKPTEAQAGRWPVGSSLVSCCRPTRFPLLLCWHFSCGTGLPLACPPGFPCCWVTGILPESCLLDSVVLDIDGEGSTFGKWAGGRHLLETGVKGLCA